MPRVVKQDAADAGDHGPPPRLERGAAVVVQLVYGLDVFAWAASAAEPAPRDRSYLHGTFTATTALHDAVGSPKVGHRPNRTVRNLFKKGTPPSP